MKLIDTHAHVYDLHFRKEEGVDTMVAKSKKEGLVQVYMPNLNLESLPRMLAVEKQFPNFFRSMIGLHPCEIDTHFEEKLAQLEKLIDTHSFVGIGEMGIDLFHSTKYIEEQKAAFEIQAKWARMRDLPLVIHCREGFEALFECLEKVQDGTLRGVVHCFTGTLAEAERCIELGFYLGIGGIVTYKSTLAEIMPSLSLEHLVLETDSPYLSPIPKRGKPNEPSHLPHIADKIAVLKGIDVEKVAEATTQNALALFEKE